MRLAAQLLDERFDLTLDQIADRAVALKGLGSRGGNLPIETPAGRQMRAGVPAAHRHDRIPNSRGQVRQTFGGVPADIDPLLLHDDNGCGIHLPARF